MYRSHFVVFACLSALVAAEPPATSGGGSSIVSQRLLNRVADIIADGGDGSVRAGDDGTQNNEGPLIVNQELLERIARIISQNDGQLSWSQNKAHGKSEPLSQAGNEISQQYGLPPKEVPENARELIGEQFQLSPPEPVPRIAAFDLTGEDDGGYPASPQIFQDSYADNRNFYQQNNGRLQLGPAESAQRIASFDIEGEQPPAPYLPPQARGGYPNNG